MKTRYWLARAAKVAISQADDRRCRHGAVAIGLSGIVVQAPNGAPLDWDPASHAEARALRKVKGPVEILFVVRVMASGEMGLSRPCPPCQTLLRNRQVRKVVYSEPGRGFTVFYPGP